MRSLFIFLIISTSFYGVSQDGPYYKNQVKFNPFIPFGVINQAIELGYERNYYQFATEVRGSIALPNSVWDSKAFVPQQASGFRLTIQEKYYYFSNENISRYYGASIDYIRRSHNRQMYFDPYTEVDSLYGTYSYADTIRVHRNVYSFNLTTGTQYNFNKFYIEFQFGIGIRLHDVEHSDRINPSHYLSSPRHPSVDYLTSIEGQRIGISIPLALRLGYRF